jgi:hypothetical protein
MEEKQQLGQRFEEFLINRARDIELEAKKQPYIQNLSNQEDGFFKQIRTALGTQKELACKYEEVNSCIYAEIGELTYKRGMQDGAALLMFLLGKSDFLSGN